MEAFAATIGLDAVQFRYCIGLVGVFPLAFVHRYIQSTEVRLWYSFITGISLSTAMFGLESLHYVFSIGVSLLMMHRLPVQVAPWWVLFWNLAYLAYGYEE